MGPRACQAVSWESIRPASRLRSSTSHGLVRPTARSAALIDKRLNGRIVLLAA